MILRDTTDIRSTPEAIFQFFRQMEWHYVRWHPDHRLFRWVTGGTLATGNIFYFEEVIAGKLLKKNVVLTRVDPPAHIEFAPTFWLMRLFLPRLLFRIEVTAPQVCTLVAEIHLRMGPLAARINQRELEAVREHQVVAQIMGHTKVDTTMNVVHASARRRGSLGSGSRRIRIVQSCSDPGWNDGANPLCPS
jgi:hypothetical protein